jgi:hypothetical protein
MSKEKLVTEFLEKVGEYDFSSFNYDSYTTEYSENMAMGGDPLVMEEGDGVTEFSEDLDLPGESEDDATYLGGFIPGSDMSLAKDDDDEEEEDMVEKITDWLNDNDVAKFMEFLMSAYPGNIPRHDGTSIVGCERAINYINDLNKQISTAVRMDKQNILDPVALENVRVNMIKDTMTLKEHANKLKRKLKNQHGKSAEDASEETIKVGADLPGAEDLGSKPASFKKEATTPRIQLVMTPFERAITGMLINGVVSAGHPFEDVFAHLKRKYSLEPREELSIIQLASDMGYPIFKDRGTISAVFGDGDSEGKNGHGIDFMRNYFA